LGTTITNQIIQEENNMRPNSGNAFYHSVQKLMSPRLAKNVKIRIHKTNFTSGSVRLRKLAFDINGGTWTEGFENRALRRIFGRRRYEMIGDWRKLHYYSKDRHQQLRCHKQLILGIVLFS
jgi:hypothetical protein